jgi:hypothetical protein
MLLGCGVPRGVTGELTPVGLSPAIRLDAGTVAFGRRRSRRCASSAFFAVALSNKVNAERINGDGTIGIGRPLARVGTRCDQHRAHRAGYPSDSLPGMITMLMPFTTIGISSATAQGFWDRSVRTAPTVRPARLVNLCHTRTRRAPSKLDRLMSTGPTVPTEKGALPINTLRESTMVEA